VTRLPRGVMETAPPAPVSVGALVVTKAQEDMAMIRLAVLALAAPATTRHLQVDMEAALAVPLAVVSKKVRDQSFLQWSVE